MSRGEKHPVHDFLFEYYSFRPAHLLRWTPGADVLLEGASPGELSWSEFVPADGGLILSAAVAVLAVATSWMGYALDPAGVREVRVVREEIR